MIIYVLFHVRSGSNGIISTRQSIRFANQLKENAKLLRKIFQSFSEGKIERFSVSQACGLMKNLDDDTWQNKHDTYIIEI